MHLRSFPDIFRLSKKFQRQKGTLQDVVRIYQVVISLPALISCIKSVEGTFSNQVQSTFVDQLNEYSSELKRLQEMVEECVDLKAADNHEYLIKCDFNAELAELERQMSEAQCNMQRIAGDVALSFGLEFGKKLKFENNSQYGHVLRLSRIEANNAGIGKGTKAGIIELNVQKAGVLFTTSDLKFQSEEYGSLIDQYKKLQSNVAKEIIQLTESYFVVLDKLNDLIAYIDVITAFSAVSVQAPIEFVRPEMHLDDDEIIIKDARHVTIFPLILAVC